MRGNERGIKRRRLPVGSASAICNQAVRRLAGGPCNGGARGGDAGSGNAGDGGRRGIRRSRGASAQTGNEINVRVLGRVTENLLEPVIAAVDEPAPIPADGNTRSPIIAVEWPAPMMRQSHHLAAVELHFDDLVCIRFPRGRLEVGIARSVGFDEGPAAAVRGGDVNCQAPIEGKQARLAPIR